MRCKICKTDNFLLKVENDLVCEDCRDDLATQCSKCDNWFYDDNIIHDDNYSYCEDCYDFYFNFGGDYNNLYGVCNADFL